MKDYLSELCTNLNIELVYTDDVYTALSVSTRGKKVYLNVDKIFMGCSEKVAKAVVGYYTEAENEDSNLKTINNYIHDNIVTVEYTIEPPNENISDIHIKHTASEAFMEDMTPENKPQKRKTSQSGTAGNKTSGSKTPASKTSGNKKSGGKTPKGSTPKASMPKDSTSSLVEFEIASMTRKSFNGGTVKVNPNEAIKVSRDDVVELDIEIDGSEL